MFTHNFQEKRYKSPQETNNGKRLVEKQGYISAQKRIQNLMDAGRRLDMSRKEQYDFPDGNIDEEAYDPTRRPGYDMADAFQDSVSAGSRIKARQTAQEQRIEAEKPKTDNNPIEVKND